MNKISNLDFVQKCLEVFDKNKKAGVDYTEPVKSFFEIKRKIEESDEKDLSNLDFDEKYDFLNLSLIYLFLKSDVDEKEIKEYINGNGHSQTEDWFFSLMVRNYLKEISQSDIKDLKDIPSFQNKGRICDYMVSEGKNNYLYEVTSMYKESEEKTNIREITYKIKTKLDEKEYQLKNTEKIINQKTIKNFCIDISRYYKKIPDPDIFNGKNISVSGFNDNDIDEILSDINLDDYPYVDNLTICWKNIFFYGPNNFPVGILYNSKSVKQSKYNMGSFVTEMYFSKDNKNIVKELRIRKAGQYRINDEINYFETSFNNFYDPGSFYNVQSVK